MPLRDNARPKARAVVFDLDGTLVDSLPDLYDALTIALAEVGCPAVPQALVRDSLHAGLHGSARAALAYLSMPATFVSKVTERYAHHYACGLARHTRAYPGVETMLDRFARAGVRLGVCTNKGEAQARQLLTHLALADYFGVVIGADTVSRSKPDPAPLRAALTALGTAPQCSLMVGDSEVDLACAQAAGLACAIHVGGYGRFADAPPGADLLLHSYEGRDLEALLAFVDAPPPATPPPARRQW